MMSIFDIHNRALLEDLMTPNEIREYLGLEPIKEPELEITYTNRTGTNCKNCGAPLPKSGKCEYCGTQY